MTCAPIDGPSASGTPIDHSICSCPTVVSRDEARETYYMSVEEHRTPFPAYGASALPYFVGPDAAITHTLTVPLEGYDGLADVDYVRPNGMSNVSLASALCNCQEAIRKITSTVVRIEGTKGNQGWVGSGVIVDPKDLGKWIDVTRFPAGTYFILTNDHVEGDADGLYMTLPNGREVTAKIALSSHNTRFEDVIGDIAILTISKDQLEPGQTLATARLGSSASLKIGQPIFAAGHPHNLPNLVITGGQVTQPKQWTGHDIPGIQTDAAINGGNSGGPMFNEHGEVVGLNTYRFRNSDNTAFAMPIDEQLAILHEIETKGEIVRGYIPVDFTALPLRLRILYGFTKANGYSDDTGAIVSWVDPESEARKAGLKEGDIVTSLEIYGADGEPWEYDVNLYNPYQTGMLNRLIHSLEPGSYVVLKVHHLGEKGYGPMDEIVVDVEMLTPELIEKMMSKPVGVA